MLVKFNGPEGAFFVGKELRAANIDSAKIGALADLQIATGWTMPVLMEHAKLEMVGVQILAFLTLRNAGMFVSWQDVCDVALADLEIISEPGDGAGPDEDPRQGGSTPDAAPAVAAQTAQSPTKRAKPGSGKRSGPGK